jgi:hypothetical protein
MDESPKDTIVEEGSLGDGDEDLHHHFGVTLRAWPSVREAAPRSADLDEAE